MRIQDVTLRATVADYRQGPRENLPQVAFAGRSNVGKSSLLNSLTGQRLAKVSKEPGKTRTINYYLIDRRLFFVDLPGYGYAKVSREQREGWGERVTAYLLREERLRLVIGLVDPRIPPSPLDAALAAFVARSGRPFLVVLTKADRISAGGMARAVQMTQRELGLTVEPIPFSARTGLGKNEILAAISDTMAA